MARTVQIPATTSALELRLLGPMALLHHGQPIDLPPSRKARAALALLALATGWDMTGNPPVKLDWRSVHFFVAHGGGRVAVGRLNVPLEGAP